MRWQLCGRQSTEQTPEFQVLFIRKQVQSIFSWRTSMPAGLSICWNQPSLFIFVSTPLHQRQSSREFSSLSFFEYLLQDINTSMLSQSIITMLGYQILAKSLAKQGVQHTYGIVGIPVIELGYAIQGAGINYYGFRNQQQAAYSAGYCGYLTGIPGVCLCVSGPGHTNAISGVLNAWVNTWPMILISGSNDLNQTSRQAFQEVDQVYFVKPYTKYSVRITNAEDIPYHVEKAVKLSITGRPGPVFLDLPGDVLNQRVESNITFGPLVQPPLYCPDPREITKAVYAIKVSRKPLIIVGKGAAYGRAEQEVTALVNSTGIPFLPTPMGKGVVPDSHELNASSARSTALKESDCIVLIGARLNWILHFGMPPRFRSGVKIVQIDIQPEEHDHNIQSFARLVGDCKSSVSGLIQALKGFKTKEKSWVNKIKLQCEKNMKLNTELIAQDTSPMTYYNSMGTIKKYLPEDMILVGEGANTMDIGRTIFTHEKPRRKLDAATFGTMGIGLPAVIAAQSAEPNLWTVAVMGDSAFGFSGMECETLTRYKMGAVIFIINNNGIYSGTEALEGEPKEYGVTHLNPDSKYEKISEAFGGKGYNVTSKKQLEELCKTLFIEENKKKLIVVNVHIEPSSSKKPQESAWLTRKAPAAKL